MGTRTVTFKHNKTYKLDRHGFLDPPEQWDDEFAEGMAEQSGIFGGLTTEHWTFIRYLRRKFIIEKTVPVVVIACVENKIRLSKLRALFPTGYHRGACKIAGINQSFMYQHNIWLTYESYRILKSKYELSPAGFLQDFDKWDQKFAYEIASEWNLASGLDARHWNIIDYLRNYYQSSRNIPTVYETCKANDIALNDLKMLFPDGYRRGACRAAGLPFFS
jgi:tRNA 2-thiouridine synthesizing protein E